MIPVAISDRVCFFLNPAICTKNIRHASYTKRTSSYDIEAILGVLNPSAPFLYNVVRIKLQQPQQGRIFRGLLKETGWLLLSIFFSSVLTWTLFLQSSRTPQKNEHWSQCAAFYLKSVHTCHSSYVILDLFSNSSQRLQRYKSIWALAAT